MYTLKTTKEGVIKMYIIKNVQVYAPKYLGICDVLFDQHILMINKNIQLSNCEEIDGTGLKLVPGFIDGHVHITGGGEKMDSLLKHQRLCYRN